MTPYGETAMSQELASLRAAPEGDRNNSLNMTAYRLAQLIIKGHIDETDLVAELQQAAAAIGLEPREAMQTIRSGIKRGRDIIRGPEPGAQSPAGPKIRPLTLAPPPQSSWSPDPSGYAPAGIWQEKAAALVDYASRHLLQTQIQTDWLAARGIDEVAAKAYRLGWLPGQEGKDIFRTRASWGIPPEQRDDGSDKPLWIPIGLVIPLIDIKGQVKRIRIRRPTSDPRYYVLPGSQMDCYMLPKTSWHRAYILVESELDAILLDTQAGDLCGVVALGSSSRKPDARTWAAVSQAATVLVALDNDPAGQKASAWYAARLPQARIHPAPAGKDPGEAYAHGVDIRDWIKDGLPHGWFMNQKVQSAGKGA